MFKKAAKKRLAVAPSQQSFWVNMGPVLKDLKELREALSKMAEGTYTHHVNKAKNDFAKWTAEVLQEAELGKALWQCKSRKDALKAVEAHLKKYDV